MYLEDITNKLLDIESEILTIKNEILPELKQNLAELESGTNIIDIEYLEQDIEDIESEIIENERLLKILKKRHERYEKMKKHSTPKPKLIILERGFDAVGEYIKI